MQMKRLLAMMIIASLLTGCGSKPEAEAPTEVTPEEVREFNDHQQQVEQSERARAKANRIK